MYIQTFKYEYENKYLNMWENIYKYESICSYIYLYVNVQNTNEYIQPTQSLWGKCVVRCKFNCSLAAIISVQLQSTEQWDYPRLSVQCCSSKNLNECRPRSMQQKKHQLRSIEMCACAEKTSIA